jgi:hypothetical protein
VNQHPCPLSVGATLDQTDVIIRDSALIER